MPDRDPRSEPTDRTPDRTKETPGELANDLAILVRNAFCDGHKQVELDVEDVETIIALLRSLPPPPPADLGCKWCGKTWDGNKTLCECGGEFSVRIPPPADAEAIRLAERLSEAAITASRNGPLMRDASATIRRLAVRGGA